MYRTGEQVVWWAFTSTTTNIGVLENPMFLGKTGPRTIFQIATSKAVDVKDFSALPGESEYLLPPGIVLEVTGTLGPSADGLVMVSCAEDLTAPALIK